MNTTDLDTVNADLKRLAALLPRGGVKQLERQLGFHRNTIGKIIEGENLNLTDNVLKVHEGLRKYMRNRIDELMKQADDIHRALKPEYALT